MVISYRTKEAAASIGVEIESELNEGNALKILVFEMKTIGCVYTKSKIPNSKKSYFNRDGSLVFGLKTKAEIKKFIADTKPILEKYDDTFSSDSLLRYSND